MKLYELAESYRMLQQMEEAEGASFAQALEDLQDEAEFKLVNIAKLLRELEAEESAFAVEIQRMQNRKKSIQNKIDSLKAYAQTSMKSLELREAGDEIIKISLQDSAYACQVTDESIIPSNFIKYTLEVPGNELPEDMQHFIKEKRVSKTDILKIWRDGLVIPGTEIVKGTSIRVR